MVPALAIALVLLWAATATAARPLVTEDTGTLEPGEAELELSASHARSTAEGVWLASAALNFGLVSRLEVKVEGGVAALDVPGRRGLAGVTDSIVGGKYRIVDGSPRSPAVMGVVAVRLPTGDDDRGLGRPDVDVTALGALSKTLGPVALTVNTGPTFVTGDRDQDFWTLAGSLELRASGSLTLVAEAVSELPISAGDPRLVVRAGAVYRVLTWLAVDGAVGSGLTGRTPDVLVTVGVTISLGALRW